MSFGNYHGEVVAKWLRHDGDDRDMELLEDFEYTDQHGVTWKAPKGSEVNGASIPGALWSTVGPPFVGDYRRASVIHDVACEEKAQPHEQVHLMFYNAMRADGVGFTRATVMYQAVKRFGPKWNTAGGSIRSRATASDEDVAEFARAVEAAAEELGESAGMDAIEARADAIFAEGTSGTSGSKPTEKSGKRGKNRKRTRTTVSRVEKVDRRKSSEEPSANDAAPIAISSVSPAVREQLAGTQRLSEFRDEAVACLEPFCRSFASKQSFTDASVVATGPSEILAAAEDGLSNAERLRLVDQALILLDQNYVHRPLKEAMYAVDPVQRLKLLREQVLRNESEEGFDGDVGFHRELLKIFLSTRDIHTNYMLPSPFAQKTAYVPFLVEDYFDPDDAPTQRRFLVTRVVGDFPGGFEPGVEIVRWNGVQIEREVEINGERFSGSNREASRARGLETLTVRPLMQSLPPDEDFVLIEYRKEDGSHSEVRFNWLVFSPDTSSLSALRELRGLTAVAQGIDLEQAMVRLAKQVLFAPESVAAAAKMAKRSTPKKGQGLESLTPSVLQARSVTVEGEDYGYVRIRTFSVDDADELVSEFVRLVEQLPQKGLIIDVRGNGGGLILAGEQLLQVLTPHRIQPSLFQMLNTPLNRRLVERLGFLSAWRESMRQAVQTGAAFSKGFPITPAEKANDIGQRYHGPVVLITDALCYSTTDIFAAGFQDHDIGVIIGIDNNTGAGGANVWTHDLLRDFLQADDRSPYEELPADARMRVSIRRTVRVGRSSGTVLEDLGVVPDMLHPMTREDLLDGNVDLMARAAAVLAEQPNRRLDAELVESEAQETIVALATAGLDRVDIYDRSRPLGSIDVEDGETEISVIQEGPGPLEMLGFSEGRLLARRRVSSDA